MTEEEAEKDYQDGSGISGSVDSDDKVRLRLTRASGCPGCRSVW
ncbi:MAG: hypothetical protein R2810_01580 [Flavobacteriales bacterium]